MEFVIRIPIHSVHLVFNLAGSQFTAIDGVLNETSQTRGLVHFFIIDIIGASQPISRHLGYSLGSGDHRLGSDVKSQDMPQLFCDSLRHHLTHINARPLLSILTMYSRASGACKICTMLTLLTLASTRDGPKAALR